MKPPGDSRRPAAVRKFLDLFHQSVGWSSSSVRARFSRTLSVNRLAYFRMKAIATHNRGSSSGHSNKSGSLHQELNLFNPTRSTRIVYGCRRQRNQICRVQGVFLGVGLDALDQNSLRPSRWQRAPKAASHRKPREELDAVDNRLVRRAVFQGDEDVFVHEVLGQPHRGGSSYGCASILTLLAMSHT